ncbi:TonB C-terminal domain-containing protein [Helicobacter baculiformis]|uniref:TonB C-terminal domain-containing protein n=1 Tax=Helicobacter baculiformis TaxID=427351 RepID=A0ABV7ZJR0_9HELI|nr:TonB C-terminal domain-containing protein [Helicobacter baculiformis]
MGNKTLAIGSGILACACYAVLLILLLGERVEDVRISQEESMDVNFIINTLPTPAPVPAPTLNPVSPTPSPATIPFREPGVSDIFSSVPEPQPQKLEDTPQKKEIQEMQTLLKNMGFNQHQKAFKDLKDSLNTVQEQLQVLKHKNIDLQVPKDEKNDKQEYQAWFQEIYRILYGHWKLGFKQPASVYALITISDMGQFSFAIIGYSPFPAYNQEIENLLTSLQGQKFPPYPKGTITLKVNFKTKD